MNENKIAIKIPKKYKATITKLAYLGKNAAVNNAYIGSLAEQLIKGVNKIVIFLSLLDGKVLVDIIAGTEQPKPISIGTKLRPDNHIFLSGLSIINATLAMYPLSSNIDKKKNNTTIIGKKLSTLPTPEKAPSITNECTIGLSP